jgi:hypothetical protein
MNILVINNLTSFVYFKHLLFTFLWFEFSFVKFGNQLFPLIVIKMPLTVEERELKFRLFIKFKARGMKKSRIMREIGKYLTFFINIFSNF